MYTCTDYVHLGVNSLKRTKYILLAFLILLAISLYAYSHIIRLLFISYSDFWHLDTRVFLSEKLPKDAAEPLVSVLMNAKKRIGAHFGEPYAMPTIVVLSTQDELRDYGLDTSLGKLLFVPWDSYLLLNYNQLSVDVTAHELVHAEIVHRVGYLKRQLEIPTWFDEGAAMQVDFREKYTSLMAINPTEFLNLTRLDTPSKFWTHDKNETIKHYQMAKSAVKEIFQHSNDSLYLLLEKIRNGEDGVINAKVRETYNALHK